MASPKLRLETNVEGDFFVDETCIDCDTCRWMAPATFERRENQSAVVRQPADAEERLIALQALVSCPTASIGTVDKHDLKPVTASIPIELADGVYHCGYHHESSFGAASYLIVRDAGNVLVDSPRFTRPLVKRLEELGGVATLFLSHRDDVADHERYAEHFGCERILHERDLRPSTRGVERQLAGSEPVPLDDELRAIPTPGHTEGSVCLLYRDTFLFTGDHLAWNEPADLPLGFRRACWYDWPQVVESTRRLADYRFEWILPGHGRRRHLPAGEMAAALARGIAHMETL